MKTMIYPHQYNYIRSVILRLKNVYKTVNDKENRQSYSIGNL